jgi:hypothetical protein
VNSVRTAGTPSSTLTDMKHLSIARAHITERASLTSLHTAATLRMAAAHQTACSPAHTSSNRGSTGNMQLSANCQRATRQQLLSLVLNLQQNRHKIGQRTMWWWCKQQLSNAPHGRALACLVSQGTMWAGTCSKCLLTSSYKQRASPAWCRRVHA